jgi:hypothetical protein
MSTHAVILTDLYLRIYGQHMPWYTNRLYIFISSHILNTQPLVNWAKIFNLWYDPQYTYIIWDICYYTINNRLDTSPPHHTNDLPLPSTDNVSNYWIHYVLWNPIFRDIYVSMFCMDDTRWYTMTALWLTFLMVSAHRQHTQTSICQWNACLHVRACTHTHARTHTH